MFLSWWKILGFPRLSSAALLSSVKQFRHQTVIHVIKSISLPQRRIPRPNVKIIIENSFSAFLNRHLLVLVTEYYSLQTRKTSMYTELHCISCGDISIQFLYCPTNVLSVYCTVAAKCCRELPSIIAQNNYKMQNTPAFSIADNTWR